MPQDFFGWVIYLIKEYGPLFLQGAVRTLSLALVGTVCGFLIGLIVAIVRTVPLSKKDPLLKRVVLRFFRGLFKAYIEIFRCTPMMVQAMVIYYGIFTTVGASHALYVGMFIISINTGAYMAEIIRGGIISVDKGQTEGAQSIGMTHWQTMVNVVLPQAVRNIMPSIGNEFVVNIKDSSVLSVISVAEVFFVAKSAAGTYMHFFESFLIASVVYFVLAFTITRILLYFEKKMDGPQNYTIHGSQTVPDGEFKIKEGGAS